MTASKGRGHLKILLRIFLFVVFVGILWFTVELDDILTLLGNISLWHILIALLIYFLVYVMRAFRYRIIYSNLMEIEWRIALKIALLHGLFNRILPARVGELSFIVMLSKEKKVPWATSTVSLIVLRLFDLFVCSIVFLIGVVFSELKSNSRLLMTAVLIVASLALIFACLPKCLELMNRLFVKYSRFGSKFAIDKQAVNAFFASGIMARMFFVSSLIWIATYTFFMVLIDGFGMNLTIMQSAFAITMAVITNLLPISGLGGFGTMELGWTFGFMYLNVDYSLALSSGVMSNLFSFLATLLFGMAGLLIKTGRLKRDVQ